MRHGEIEGAGRYESAEGHVTTGQFLRGKVHGHATRVLASNATYTGEWRDGVAHGAGVFTFTSGDVYVGVADGTACRALSPLQATLSTAT